MTRKQVRKIVRDQIAFQLQCDLDGDEAIMKEAWEAMETDAAKKMANRELKEVIAWLREK